MNLTNQRLHRPKADTVEISDLLDDARKGKFELPDFQRVLEWREEDRIKLFDSIYRGFPIGDILLWEPETQKHGSNRFGPFVPGSRAANPWLVVDGQQRLSTLFGCLLLADRANDDDVESDDWRFAFDTDKQRIVRLPASPRPELLPLTTAIDTARYLGWARGLPDERREERLQAGDDFSKALRTYRIPYYVVRTEDRSLLQRVFERVNTSGKSLSGTDVFNALFPTRLNDVAKALHEQTQFGVVDVDWLLQAAKVMVGMDPAGQFARQLNSAKDDSDEMDPGLFSEDEDRSMREMLEGIHIELLTCSQHAIGLIQEIGIRRVEALPYAIIVPVLTHFFHQYGTLSEASAARQTLIQFVWQVSAGGATHWNRATFLRRVARIIRTAKGAQNAAQLLLDSVEATIVGDLVGHHDWRSGTTRLVALALFELGPRELGTGQPLAVWELVESLGHEMFPRLWTRGVDPYAASTANRIISGTRSDKRSAQPGRQLERMRGLEPAQMRFFAEEGDSEYLTEACISQAITPEAMAALRAGNRVEFLELRAARITSIVDDFLDRRQIVRRPR